MMQSCQYNLCDRRRYCLQRVCWFDYKLNWFTEPAPAYWCILRAAKWGRSARDTASSTNGDTNITSQLNARRYSSNAVKIQTYSHTMLLLHYPLWLGNGGGK